MYDVYGVCEQCQINKKKFTNLADATFTDWVKSEEYPQWVDDYMDSSSCNVVFKKDCINHISKNFRKDPESLAKSGLKIDGLASITRSKNTI